MCCFSRPIKHVSATHIFARHIESGRQVELAFRRVPSPASVAEIRRRLNAIVVRAVA